MANTNFKFIEKYKVNNNNKITVSIQKLIVNDITIMEERVNIGWERCIIYDGTAITQCLKCKGCNHLAKDCRNEEICF